MINKLINRVTDIFKRNEYLRKHTYATAFDSKYYTQLMVSCAFLILSIANIIAKSYIMLALTAGGCVVNLISAVVAKKLRKSEICAFSSIITCSLLFGFFAIYGGNDGFACLWVVLLPFLSMVVMDFVIGLCASAFFQIFLITVFWTPIRYILPYEYNDQFCLRFPLFFFVTFILGLLLTVSLKKSQYYEYKHSAELEKMTEAAHKLARTDYLTGLANRRCAYEEFEAHYTDDGVHCIVMGDIDYFKKINDTYGHEFGDDVLVTFARYIKQQLPEAYLKSRWGGEEFLIAANEPMNKVYVKIENLRKAIEKHEFIYEGTSVRITITFGISEYYRKDELDSAIDSADDRLYIGKKATRNCTVITDK